MSSERVPSYRFYISGDELKDYRYCQTSRLEDFNNAKALWDEHCQKVYPILDTLSDPALHQQAQEFIEKLLPIASNINLKKILLKQMEEQYSCLVHWYNFSTKDYVLPRLNITNAPSDDSQDKLKEAYYREIIDYSSFYALLTFCGQSILTPQDIVQIYYLSLKNHQDLLIAWQIWQSTDNNQDDWVQFDTLCQDITQTKADAEALITNYETELDLTPLFTIFEKNQQPRHLAYGEEDHTGFLADHEAFRTLFAEIALRSRSNSPTYSNKSE